MSRRSRLPLVFLRCWCCCYLILLLPPPPPLAVLLLLPLPLLLLLLPPPRTVRAAAVPEGSRMLHRLGQSAAARERSTPPLHPSAHR